MAQQIAPQARERVEATSRAKISRATRARVFLAQDGRCAKCRAKLFRPYIVDHVIQLWMGGADEPSNMQAVCRSCDAPKTAKDATDRAKVKRLIAKDTEPREPSRLQGRGFQQHPTLKRTMSGKVVAR